MANKKSSGTQRADQSKINQGKQGAGYQQGSGKTFRSALGQEQHGGLKKKK